MPSTVAVFGQILLEIAVLASTGGFDFDFDFDIDFALAVAALTFVVSCLAMVRDGGDKSD